MSLTFEKLCTELSELSPFLPLGRVGEVTREYVRLKYPGISVGTLVEAHSEFGPIPLEVVSLSPSGHVAMPLDSIEGIRLGDFVQIKDSSTSVPVGDALLGQVIDSTGCSYETGQPIVTGQRMSLKGARMNPMERALIDKPLDLGIRALNGLLTCGLGQRQGIFAGSGVGKSVLLGMMARYTSADVVVIGLIGERGREVREFIERDLGPEARKRAVVVVETSDKSAVRRVRGAYTATTVAEYFRSQGKNVLLMMDSLTRFAMAQREIGISAGEPPTTKAYPPSVYSALSSLLERAGYWGDGGSITGLYTVLVEGDDLEDPVADACRAILDGHIVLSRQLANRGHYPAIDVLASISRVMDSIVSKPVKFDARVLKQLVAKYQENEDAIHYGVYQKGSDEEIEEAIRLRPEILKYLQQDREERASLEDSFSGLSSIFKNSNNESP